MIIASDGLPARRSGTWARVKLSFLDDFCPAAIQATATKHHRYYVDLFAGPGINVPKSRGPEFEGSPLRVLRYTGTQRHDISFTHAVFINERRKDHDALRHRVRGMVEAGHSRLARDNIKLRHGDANELVGAVFHQIPTKAYVFVFADMEAPRQWPWESMKRLRALGHTSVDLYTLFPLDMAILRLLSYSQDGRERHARALTSFFGTDGWRELVEQRRTTAQAAELRLELLELYLNQLRTLWRHAGPIVDVFLRGRQRLYKMLFASDHDVGARIANWIKRRGPSAEQPELF